MREQHTETAPSRWSRLKQHFAESFSGGFIYRRRLYDGAHTDRQVARRRRDAYRYVLIALAFVLVSIDVHSFYIGEFLPAVVGLFLLVIYIANIWQLSANLDAPVSPVLILSMTLAALLLAIYYGQTYTMYWLYPLLVLMPVMVRRRAAIWLGIMCGVVLAPLVFQRTDASTAIVICLSMLLTWLVSAWIMYAAAEQSRRLKTMADTDPLTGAYNRRFFQSQAGQALEKWQRSERPASLLLIDVDYFKRINDKHGHVVGDQALKNLVNTITGRVREVDTVCRYGGEEFVLLLLDTAADSAMRIAEQIRAKVEAFRPADAAAMTISIGVCDVLGVQHLDQWLNLTDAALYLAKKNGRNRVELATSRAVPQEIPSPDRTVPEWR